MSTQTLASRQSSRRVSASTAGVTVLRIAGAGLLGSTAGIHAYLWDVGYRNIPTIGPLFLLDVIGAGLLLLAVLGAPRWLVGFAAIAGALLEAGTVGGLILATERPLFGFVESTQATLYWQAVITEIAGAAVLAGLAVLTIRRPIRRTAAGPWW